MITVLSFCSSLDAPQRMPSILIFDMAISVMTSFGGSPNRSISSSTMSLSSSSVAIPAINLYISTRVSISLIYVSGIYALTLMSTAQSLAVTVSPRSSATASSSSFIYISKPTVIMCPLCSAPSTLPAPRISRSRIAIFSPEPNSVNSLMVISRLYASVESVLPFLNVKYAYALLSLLPTRPLI